MDMECVGPVRNTYYQLTTYIYLYYEERHSTLLLPELSIEN